MRFGASASHSAPFKPACADAPIHPIGASAQLFRDRNYAITDPAGNLASGRAEDSRSFSRKFGSASQIFVKKIKSTMLPQANRVFIG
ncbi:MAG: hypothetical protein ACLFVO_20970 [Chloroflexaceae bacterium]